MKILTCTDGSRISDNAIKFSGIIGKGLKSRITMLHVVKCELPMKCGWVMKYKSKDSEGILRKARDIISGFGLDAITKTRSGKIDGEIIKETKGDYDLLVIGSHGVKGIEMFFFGAVSYKVIENVRIPVLVVKKGRTSLSRILMCTGGSRYAEKAIRFGGKIAKALNADVTILHVVKNHAQKNARGYRDGERYLKRGVNILKKIGIDAKTVLVGGHRSKRVVREAEEGNYDLIIMGTHGMDPMKLLFSGSVVYEVLKNTKVPCLIVK